MKVLCMRKSRALVGLGWSLSLALLSWPALGEARGFEYITHILEAPSGFSFDSDGSVVYGTKWKIIEQREKNLTLYHYAADNRRIEFKVVRRSPSDPYPREIVEWYAYTADAEKNSFLHTGINPEGEIVYATVCRENHATNCVSTTRSICEKLKQTTGANSMDELEEKLTACGQIPSLGELPKNERAQLQKAVDEANSHLKTYSQGYRFMSAFEKYGRIGNVTGSVLPDEKRKEDIGVNRYAETGRLCKLIGKTTKEAASGSLKRSSGSQSVQ